MLTDREKFILQFMLKLLNEYSAHVMGTKYTEPRKVVEGIRRARAGDVTKKEEREIIREIKEEMSIVGSYLDISRKFSDEGGSLFSDSDEWR